MDELSAQALGMHQPTSIDQRIFDAEPDFRDGAVHWWFVRGGRVWRLWEDGIVIGQGYYPDREIS